MAGAIVASEREKRPCFEREATIGFEQKPLLVFASPLRRAIMAVVAPHGFPSIPTAHKEGRQWRKPKGKSTTTSGDYGLE